MIKRFFILLLAIVASVGMSWADGIPCTAADLGKVLCSDGSIYATVSDATAASKTAVAMIAYIDTENKKGLALALVEESGNINWSNAISTCAAKTPTVTGGTWKLASEDEWNKIINAAGGRNALRDGFSAIGGTNLSSGGNDKYWSSTESSNTEKGRCVSFNDTFGGWKDATKTATYPYYARACLEFNIGEPAAEPIPCTAADLGKVLCTDGSIYATVSEATAASKTAAAVIAYVDTENGKALALALADDGGEMDWATANTTAAAHTPAVSGGTWTLASKDDWDNMINAAGSYTALRDGFSAVGGTNMQQEAYWSSTSFSFYAWCYRFQYGSWFDDYQDGDDYVRACLAFDIPAAPAYETVMNLINAIGTVELTAECKAKIDAARTAYDALSDGDKAQVTNIATLTTAETDYAALAAAAAAPVIAQIEALPTTIKLSTYFSTYDLMVAARAAYNALSAEVQAAVTNLSKLTNLEAAFAAIGGANEKLSKPFSVGAGQVVYFAHGNLQATYNGTKWSWAFAAHQYDYIGDTSGNIIINGNGTLSGPGTVDLFGWVANSSTVLTSGVAKYGVSNSTNVSDYGLGTTETLKGDWGVAANDANIGGYNDWRILSNDEWVYLFKTRTDAASKYGYATVGGVNGVIIIPDAFTDPMKNKGNLAFKPQNVDKGYSTNIYTTGGNWEAMEAAGAVFMPAAGRRYGTTMTVNEGTGFYWSSTPMSYQASYFMGFMGSNVVPDNDRYRSHGLSVRLVSNNAPVASTPLDSAQHVKDLIEAIPAEITLDAACVNAVQAAREAYNKLSEAAKGLIDEATLAKLTDAEAALTALYQVEADKVIAKINNIPTPVTLKLATRDSIESARAAYEALNAEQKALVPAADLQKLTDAEAELATLNPGGGMPAGALNGKFTINAGGDQISFAKGNLQATTEDNGANWTWSFAANQWNYLGIAVANSKINGNGTVSEDGTVDLFGWSTAATYYGINNSYKAVDYIGDFVDWGPNVGAGWRTLTKDEWNYLIENNTKGRATVNDKSGYIFLPDNWSGPAFTPDPNNFTTNVYSGDDWTAMENAGAVFLPSGPARNGVYALIANDAKYSSSTSLNNDTSYVFTIYYNQSQSACTGTNRAYGCMVRLVTEGGGATPLDSAQVVKDLIEAIPMPVTLEDACVNAVQAARDAYNALSDAAKGALDDATVQKLNQAITDYTALIQAGADAVKAKINNIPQPVTLKLATRDSIESARAAYDALTADQKALVSNYDVLTAAEATWAGLINAAPAGALSGKYTINAGGDVIYFAHGNLQYTRENLDADWSTGTFRLATNQYDLIEAVKTYPDAYCTDNYGDKTAVGLFGWGTWGEGKTPNLTSSDKTLYTWSTDFSGTLEGTNTWRTLTKDEWVYLLGHNNQSYATVHDVNGLLVAPDGKDIDGKSMENWVVINDETWTTMQNDGYLFLPACGQRSQLNETANITTGGQGEEVVYYSSTEKEDDVNRAYNIWYKKGQAPAAADYSFKRQAFGVRLVSAGVNPLDQVQVVKGLIDAIPAEITLDAACVNAIQAARAGYDALDTDAKAILDAADVKKLTDAEAALTALNQAEADKVVAKINAIPTPVELKLATRDSIQNARAAYDALNATQQALVTNYQKLLDAEDALADLVPTPTPVPGTPTVWDMNELKVGDIIYEGDQLTNMSSPRYINNVEVIRDNKCPYTLMKSAGETSYVLKDKDGSYLFTDGSLAITPTSVGLLVTNADHGDINVVVYSPANVLDSAQAVKDLIDAIPDSIVYPTSGPAIAAALVAYNQLSDAAKGALDDADVQKMTDAATLYAALDAIAAIENIPDTITYDPLVKAAIENARDKYDALIDASKALVSPEVLHKLTNAEQAWAILVAKIEHNVSYIGKDGELKHETVALLHIPDPAPEFNGYEFVRWDVKAGDFLEEGLRIKAVYTPIITTKPVAYDSLMYNGTAQTLITAGVAKEGHIEYRINDGEWSAELPKATFAAAYVVYYKLVREGHADYIADSIVSIIAKAPVVYTAPTAVDSLVYTAANQTLIAAGTTADGTFEYSLNPTLLDSWKTELPQAMTAGIHNVYYRVQGDLNHLDSVAATPVAVTIAKAALTATADNKNVTYGDAVPAYTVTYAGWKGDDDTTALAGQIAYTCAYAPTSNVGEYAITPSGVSAANYDITFVNGKVTVAKALLTVTAENKTVTYGDSIPVYTATYSGWKNGDDASVVDSLVYTCAYAPTSNVGEYTIVPSGATALNYTFAYVNGKVTVNQAALMITAEDKNVIYGDAVPTYTASYSGWKNGDEASVVTGLVYTCAYAPTSDVDEYTITPSGATATNYAISFTNGKVTVAKAALMITAEDKNVIYGDAVPTYTATYSGWKNADTESVVTGLAYTCEYAPTSNVGEYTITPNSATATNYAISYTNGKVTVAQALLTVTAENKTVTYGDAAPAFTATYSGWKNGDDASVVDSLAYTCEYAVTSNVGNYTITPNSAKALNYTFAYVNGTLTVNQAALMITAEDKTVIYGDSVPTYTAAYSGWKNSDTESVVTGLVYTCAYAPTSNVGNYTITPSGATATNYAISYTNGKVTVNQAALMITAEDKNVIYGDAVPTYTATYSGWKNGDTESVVTGLIYTCEYAVTSNVGEYTIVPSDATATNYAISYTNGKVTVAKAALTITANDTTMIYGDEHPEFTASYSGWKNADTESVVTGLAYTTPYKPGSPIGTYTINPNSASAQNYAITFVDGTLTVVKAVVSISGAEAQTAKFADGHTGAVVLNQGQLNGVKLQDAVGHVTTAAFSTADVAEHLTITLFYELTGDAALLNNYDLQPTSEVFTTEGVIIEPFIPDTTQTEEQKEEQTEVQEGIDVYAYGYCDGSGYSLKYHLNTGNPDQYKIDFADSRFTDVPWTDLDIAGKDGTIDIDIPVDMPTGDYSMTVYFRDSRFTWLESQALTVTFHVNLPETYVQPLFDNTIVLIDTCECFTDIQWYYREDSSQPWEPIPGATGHYYHADGKLTGEYFVQAKMNGVPTYTCGQDDMNTLYGDDTPKASVKAYPNPVLTTTNVIIENSPNTEHSLRIVNLMGVEMLNTTFEGSETVVDMDGYVIGNYMISVDGIVVKVMKK